MVVKFLKSVASFAYFAGDVADIEDGKAKELIETGHVTPNMEEQKPVSKLPEDFPCRDILAKQGILTIESVAEMKEVLTDINGIGEASANKILEYLAKVD